jgi:hypothetical protein
MVYSSVDVRSRYLCASTSARRPPLGSRPRQALAAPPPWARGANSAPVGSPGGRCRTAPPLQASQIQRPRTWDRGPNGTEDFHLERKPSGFEQREGPRSVRTVGGMGARAGFARRCRLTQLCKTPVTSRLRVRARCVVQGAARQKRMHKTGGQLAVGLATVSPSHLSRIAYGSFMRLRLFSASVVSEESCQTFGKQRNLNT